jgi:hypothetical protein
MHHVVMVIILDIIAMLALYYSIMSHAVLILYCHGSKLTLQNNLTSYALWLPRV